MSYAHVVIAQEVQREYEAASASLAHSKDEWSSVHQSPQFNFIDLKDIIVAREHLEKTYAVRLAARAEILFELHLKHHFPTVKIPKGAAGMALIQLTAKHFWPGSKIKIAAEIREPVEELYQWRNWIAHGDRWLHDSDSSGEGPTFDEALSALQRFLHLLPDLPSLEPRIRKAGSRRK